MIQIASFRIRILGFPFLSPIKKLITAVAPLDLNLFGVNELAALNPSVRVGKASDYFHPRFSVGFAEIAEGAS
ncbi:MAG: hypothetical protein CAF45_016710 [Nitrospira sp. CG24E]|nr:MAG: hypothetical protein CAF45_016710 [Nitrospira sp. CG24E]